MKIPKKFLIAYVGVQVKQNANNPESPRYVGYFTLGTEEFTDSVTAEKFANDNIETYYPLNDGYVFRDSRVVEFNKLIFQTMRFDAPDILKDYLKQHLDPLVDEFLMDFWASHRLKSFMNKSLNISSSTPLEDRAKVQARYMVQVFKGKYEVKLRFFHGKIKDSLLETQAFNRIYRFIMPEEKVEAVAA